MADTPKWSLQMNLAGVGLFEPGSAIDRITPGVYLAKIKDSERVAGKDGKADNIRFDGEVLDGSEKGKTFMVFISTNQSEDIIKKRWKTLNVAVVKNPASLEQGTVTATDRLYQNKEVFICVTGREGKDAQGRDFLPNIDFVTREQAERLKNAPQRVRAASAATGNANGSGPAGRQEFKVEGGEAGAQTAQPQAGQPLLE